MSDRLTRQEMKRDEVLEGLARAVEFFRENAKAIGVALLGLLVAVTGYAAWQGYQGGAERRANESLASALESIDTAQSETSEELRSSLAAVIDDHGSTKAGSVAHAYLGRAAAADGDFAAAREHWEAFLAKHSEHALAAQVERNLIALDRQEGRTEELVSRLRSQIAAGSGALPGDALLWELANALEASSQNEAALEVYEQLTEEHPSSVFASRARSRAEALTLS